MNNDSAFAYIKNTRKLTTAIYYCCWDKNEFTLGNKIVYHREYICTFHVHISNVIYYNIQVGQMCDFPKLIELNLFTQLRKIQAKFTNACVRYLDETGLRGSFTFLLQRDCKRLSVCQRNFVFTRKRTIVDVFPLKRRLQINFDAISYNYIHSGLEYIFKSKTIKYMCSQGTRVVQITVLLYFYMAHGPRKLDISDPLLILRRDR